MNATEDLLYAAGYFAKEVVLCVLRVLPIPFARLPGGHQTKNAERLAKSKAASIVNDLEMVNNPTVLLDEIRHLVKSPRLRADMANNLAKEARADAAKHLAEIILEEAGKSGQ